MYLFATVNTGYNNPQPNIDRSLGGFKSSTALANDDFSNLFDEISVTTIRSGRDEYRAIVIKNQFAEKVNRVTIKLTKPDHSMCKYRMAIGKMDGVNKYGQKFMENLAAPNNKPFMATFIDMEEGVILEVGDLEPQQEIGIWVARSVDKELAKEQYHQVAQPDPIDPQRRRYVKVNRPTEEKIDVIIEWQ